MTLVTLDQLIKIMPQGKSRLALFVAPLNAAMLEFGITTESRIEAFIAQLAHESGRFRYMRELASGAAYDNRKDLGNTEPDAIKRAEARGTTPGRLYRGHGPIQITGYYNHKRCSLALYDDLRLLDNPELLEVPADGCRAAAWFWKTAGLNEIADKIGDGVNDEAEFNQLTKRINGGWNGKEDRLAVWKVAQLVIT